MSDIPPFSFVRRQEQAWDYQNDRPDFVQAGLRDFELEDYLSTRIKPRLTTVCTSTTRPTSPRRWDRILETDTGNELVYYGATTGWQQPWNQGWGRLDNTGFFTITTSGTTVAVAADRLLSSLVPNRLLRVDWNTDSCFGDTAGNTFNLDATMDSTAIVTGTNIQIDVANQYLPSGLVRRDYTTTLTTHRFRALAVRTVGAGTFTARGYMTIMDIGPNGNAPAD